MRSAFAAGVLASWPLALVSIPFADVPVGVPLGLALYLYSEASLQHGSGAEPIALEAEAYAAFEHTLSFDPLGPVFELPEGFGADAPSAGIAGNRFVVPEPAPLAIVAFGLVALSATGKRGGSVR